ncbi:Uncharacterised protein [Mycobacteroides abscessus subsp. abscessus]|nr:Uncharacterised protein [Mycobacteroides abscessus subsp. abscessus]
MTGAADSRRLGPVNGSRGSIWTDGRTWIGLFLTSSVLLSWGILSLPLDGTVRGVMLFFAILVVAIACGVGWLQAMSSTPLPALDHTPGWRACARSANGTNLTPQRKQKRRRSSSTTTEPTGRHTAWLGDLINEASIDQFTPESSWHVYAFADPELADTMVLLTEAHDDVRRSGYLITGLHGNTEFTSLQQPAAGSPFLNGKRRFVS